MSDLIQQGAEWLSGKLKAHASRTVEYRRAGTSASVAATVGGVKLQGKTEAGTKIEAAERDYVFAVADLVAAGIAMPPARDDRVADTEGEPAGVTALYEVRPVGQDPPYRFCDGSRTMVRVHTKRVGTE